MVRKIGFIQYSLSELVAVEHGAGSGRCLPSSEFLKRDKKLDTSEVFYVRPLSNAEYVIGKIWGNLRVFLLLNLLVLAIVLAFNFMASGITVDWQAYGVYFLLISLPTLIFIIGLSIFLMLVLRNQALTFILLLGYIGLTLFYIQDKFYYLFDYMVYNLPLFKSTIVGFSSLELILNHRAIYFFAGLGIHLLYDLPVQAVAECQKEPLSVAVPFALYVLAGGDGGLPACTFYS